MIELQVENVVLANIEPNPGPAHWYVFGDTGISTLFIKVPRADITGGHGSAWREFLCGNLARATGLLAPSYYPVRVDEEMLPDSMRSNVHVADLPILAGTPYFPWGRGDFTSVRPRLRSRLAIFDTWTLHYDRSCESRIEFLAHEDGERVLLDWEASDLPSDPQRRIVYSDFLFDGIGCEASNDGLVAVSRAPDGMIDDWCSETRRWWPVAKEELTSFLQKRRDYLPELLMEVKPDLASWNPACGSCTQDDWRVLVERAVQVVSDVFAIKLLLSWSDCELHSSCVGVVGGMKGQGDIFYSGNVEVRSGRMAVRKVRSDIPPSRVAVPITRDISTIHQPLWLTSFEQLAAFLVLHEAGHVHFTHEYGQPGAENEANDFAAERLGRVVFELENDQ